jgi:tRNA A-37 threonylcarbamoyl transferase component Bud32
VNARVLADRYELGRMLGAGGMAEVYEGWDRVLARRVAVKVLSGRNADDPSFLERFRREARAAASLNHPNIVGVFDTGSDNGVSFIVMELVEGRSLRDRLQDGPLTPTQVIAVGIGVCSALAAAHANRLVHRDIKPGNIMLLPTGQVKVMDFGIARAIASEPLTNNTANVLGTAQYLAPEQAQGGEIDARADIYALGCCVYEMLAGRVPFNGESPVAIAYQHVREVPLPLRQVDPGIPQALEAITLRAMAKRPEDRFQTAEDMRAAFEQARAGHAVAPPPRAAMQPVPGATLATLPRAGGPGPVVMAGAAGLGAGTGAGLASPGAANASMAARGMGGPGAMGGPPPMMGGAGAMAAGPGMGGGQGAMGGFGGGGQPTTVFGPGPGPVGSRVSRSAAAAEEEGSAVRNRLPVVMAVITVALLLGTAAAAIRVLNPGSAPANTQPIVAALPTPDPTDTSFEEETSTSEEDEETTTTTRRQTTTSLRQTTTTAAPPTTRRTTTTRRQTTTSRRTTTTRPVEMVQVPNVLDRQQAIATATLRERGFDVSVSFVPVTDPAEDNRVQDQNPPPLSSAPRGSTVQIVVGQLKQ